MANGKIQMANSKIQIANSKMQMGIGQCGDATKSFTIAKIWSESCRKKLQDERKQAQILGSSLIIFLNVVFLMFKREII